VDNKSELELGLDWLCLSAFHVAPYFVRFSGGHYNARLLVEPNTAFTRRLVDKAFVEYFICCVCRVD
jgi:hypothetical protein